jgi:hypothetical protein
VKCEKEGFGSLDSSSSNVKIPLALDSISSGNRECKISNLQDTFDLTNYVLIVGKLDFGHIQALPFVQLLFVSQNVVVEKLLQLFIAIIYTKLFKRINREIF